MLPAEKITVEFSQGSSAPVSFWRDVWSGASPHSSLRAALRRQNKFHTAATHDLPDNPPTITDSHRAELPRDVERLGKSKRRCFREEPRGKAPPKPSLCIPPVACV